MQTFQLNSFVSALFVGTIDFHHFYRPLSVPLIMAEGYKASREQNQVNHQDITVEGDSSKSSKTSAALLITLNNFDIFWDIYEGVVIDSTEHFDSVLVLVTVPVIQVAQLQETKPFGSSTLLSPQLIWVEIRAANETYTSYSSEELHSQSTNQFLTNLY